MTETWNRIRELSNKHFKDQDVNELRTKYYEMDMAVLKIWLGGYRPKGQHKNNRTSPKM